MKNNHVETAARKPAPAEVCLSRWINERLPPVSELLSDHDVARLTRRPRWVLCSLAVIGKFPRKRRYHGRRVGWLKSEVVDWMARGLTMAECPQASTRHYDHRHPRQTCLALGCRQPCIAPKIPSERRHKARR